MMVSARHTCAEFEPEMAGGVVAAAGSPAGL